MKKVIFLLLFPLIAGVVVSCCDCMEPKTVFYTNKALAVYNLDGSGQEVQVSTWNDIQKKAYGIRIDLVREALACASQWQGLFINSANAFSCGCGPTVVYKARDSAITVRIYTNFDFDNDHPAGSDISKYFKVYHGRTFNTIEEYLQTAPVTMEAPNGLSLSRDFLLMTAPALGIDHSFKVQYTLSDGRVLERETSPVKLI